MLRIAVVAGATEGIVEMILHFECSGRTHKYYFTFPATVFVRS
jgi:hypothetical protein